jgi:Ser/Thr protein kinase RdoA (MazF antagonist)
MTTQFFFELTPDRVLEAVEASGIRCTGRCSALNSFENRVYDVEIESDDAGAGPSNRRVVKFYRPGRWTEAQILEEHGFLTDLKAAEIPVVAPLAFDNGKTLHRGEEGIWYAVFPKVGGRAPDELAEDRLLRVGRLLARIHNVGAMKEAGNRVQITPATYGLEPLKYLLDAGRIHPDSQSLYQDMVEKICEVSRPWFEVEPIHRIHGDCHLGNLLWNQDGPFFLDFDDMLRGPGVQDLWLLIPGRDELAMESREALLRGYTEMRAFSRKSLRLVEPLRALRFVHYSAWLAKRWEDPAFPKAFPQFGTPRYWADEAQDLRSQLAVIMEMKVNSMESSDEGSKAKSSDDDVGNR